LRRNIEKGQSGHAAERQMDKIAGRRLGNERTEFKIGVGSLLKKTDIAITCPNLQAEDPAFKHPKRPFPYFGTASRCLGPHLYI
jgi:hypothetical protein